MGTVSELADKYSKTSDRLAAWIYLYLFVYVGDIEVYKLILTSTQNSLSSKNC